LEKLQLYFHLGKFRERQDHFVQLFHKKDNYDRL